MPDKHSIDGQRAGGSEPNQGIVVPLDLPELTILSQSVGEDESIEVQVRAKQESVACPRCGEESSKVHDTRKRVKRDIQLRGYQVYLILHNRAISKPHSQTGMPAAIDPCRTRNAGRHWFCACLFVCMD
jgi:transposase